MGFFDKLFGGKSEPAAKSEPKVEPKFSGSPMAVLCPIDGKIVPLDKIPDETFATGILGPGCGVEPTGDTVYAPFDGVITQVAETLHAVGMTSDDGIDVLIHVGMDTVDMNGKGFKGLVKTDQKVKAGTPLLKVELDTIRAAGHPTTTAVIVTNGDDLAAVNLVNQGDAAAGASMLMCEK